MSDKVKKTKTTEQKTKRKKILWGTFWATAVVAAISAGIGIPLAQASKALPKPTPILKPSSSLFKLKLPNGEVIDLNYGSIDKNPALQNKNKHIFESIKKNISKFLYEQEYEASLRYQAIYNANKAKADEKTFALDSIDKIKEKIQKELNDLKAQYQKQYGLEKKWEEKFLEELAKEKWGSSKNEAQALEFKVNKEIEKNAYLRYQTEVNTDWSYDELKNGVKANKDVYYTFNGKPVHIAKKGETIYLKKEFGIEENKDYVLPKEDSIENKIDSKTAIKIPIFVTKSFIKEYKNPKRFIKPWLERKQAILSELSLSAKQDESDAEKPWKVNKNEIIKLLKFSSYEAKDGEVEIKLGVDALGSFAGFSSLVKEDEISADAEMQARNDKNLITRVSSDTSNANKFGSKGFINLNRTISSEEPSSYLSLLSIVLNDAKSFRSGIYKHTEKSDLFKKLKENLVNAFKEAKVTKDFKKSESGKEVFKQIEEKLENGDNNNKFNKNDETNVKKFAKYNKHIEELINKMDEKELTESFGAAFRDTFANGNSKKKINALYKVNNNFVTVNQKGILIQNVHQFTKEEDLQKLIVKDLGIKSKANYTSTFTSELFDLNSIFTEVISSSEYQIKDLLSNEKFKAHIKNQKFMPNDSNKEKKFDDNDIKGALDYIKALEQTNKVSIVSNKLDQIEKFVEKQVKDNLVVDFSYDESNNLIKLDPHTNSNEMKKDIVSYIFEVIVKYVLNIENLKLVREAK